MHGSTGRRPSGFDRVARVHGHPRIPPDTLDATSEANDRVTQHGPQRPCYGAGRPDSTGLCSPRPHLGEPIPREDLERVLVHVHDLDSHLTPRASACFVAGASRWRVRTISSNRAPQPAGGKASSTIASSAAVTAGRSKGTAILTCQPRRRRCTTGAATAPSRSWTLSVSATWRAWTSRRAR